MPIKRATKKKQKATLLFYGTSGSGKTYSALQLASLITSEKIVVIDTENETSALYSDIFDFDILALDAPYTQESFQKAFKEAEAYVGEGGVVIVDTLSKFWDGVGGALDEVNKVSGGNKAKTMDAWGTVTPKLARSREILTTSKSAHVITTCRVKSETIMEEYTNWKGEIKTKAVKVGLAPVYKADIEYDFQCSLEFRLQLTKDGHDVQIVRNTKPPRFPYFDNYEGLIRGELEGMRPWDAKDVANHLMHWLEQGEDPKLIGVKDRIAELLGTYHRLVGKPHEKEGLDFSGLNYDELVAIGKELRADVDNERVPM